jgi:hypothetical protein
MTTKEDNQPPLAPPPCSTFLVSQMDEIINRANYKEMKARNLVKKRLAVWRASRRKTQTLREIKKELTK